VSKKASKTQKPPALSSVLAKAPTKEDKLKILIKKPLLPEQRTDTISSVVAQIPLTSKALAHPVTAWKSAIRELTGHQPLSVSLIHPRKVELFFDINVIESVKAVLAKDNYLSSQEATSDKDVPRWKASYLQGYFRPPRRAMLMGLSQDQQLKVLSLAEASSKTLQDKTLRQQWSYQIESDRQWILETADDVSAMVTDATL
jgi:hypothetical protein